MLLAHVLGVSRASIIAHAERILNDAEEQRANQFLARRADGEPFAYLIGSREFYGRDFMVSPATLIPRPETEIIVEQALARLSGQNPPGMPANIDSMHISARVGTRVLDLGTGSGPIAITLALERTNMVVVASDFSRDALLVAEDNARRLNVAVEFIHSNWYQNLVGRKFDLIVSNPPYIATQEIATLEAEVRDYDPKLALDGGEDGLEFYRVLAGAAGKWLQADGKIMLEFGEGQAEFIQEIFQKQKWIVEALESDYSQRLRFLIARPA